VHLWSKIILVRYRKNLLLMIRTCQMMNSLKILKDLRKLISIKWLEGKKAHIKLLKVTLKLFLRKQFSAKSQNTKDLKFVNQRLMNSKGSNYSVCWRINSKKSEIVRRKWNKRSKQCKDRHMDTYTKVSIWNQQ
jgi:hypothetical protein